MDNRYFFIKDILNTENIKVEYCPTGKMIADFFTKPLQGNLFRKFRHLVLGYQHISEVNDESPKSGESPSQECIGNNISDETIIGDIGGGDSQPLNHKEKRISWADVVSGNR